MAPKPKHNYEEREAMILNAAVECIEASSLLDFSMASIAKSAGLSMGSVYKHMQSKEDVLIALATKMYESERKLARRIMTLPLTTPEMIIATTLFDYDKFAFYSFSSQLDHLVSNPALLKRCSEERLKLMFARSQATEQEFINGFLRAERTGELALDEQGNSYAIELHLATWSLSIGYFRNVVQHHSRGKYNTELDKESLSVFATDSFIVKTFQRLLNTYSWRQPLTDEGINRVSECLIAEKMR